MITNEELALWLLRLVAGAGAACMRAAGGGGAGSGGGLGRALFGRGPAGQFLLAVTGGLATGPGRCGAGRLGRGRVPPAAAGKLRPAGRAPAAVADARAGSLGRRGRATGRHRTGDG